MKKTDKLFSRLYIIFGAFTVICYASYLIKLIISPEGTLQLLSCLLVLLAVTVPFIFRRQLRALLGRLYLPMKIAVSCAMIFYFVTLCILVCYIHLSPSAPPAADSGEERVYVVFGAKVKEDGPTKALAARLDTAIDLMNTDGDAVCIVSGGQGPDEPFTEAECMKSYMTERGIDSSRIYKEERASSTVENIEFSLELIRELGLEDRSLVCISTDTHIPRIRLMCSHAGVEAEYIKAPTPMKQFLFTTWVREYMSYVKMLIMMWIR